jgi:hypothetical protein
MSTVKLTKLKRQKKPLVSESKTIQILKKFQYKLNIRPFKTLGGCFFIGLTQKHAFERLRRPIPHLYFVRFAPQQAGTPLCYSLLQDPHGRSIAALPVPCIHLKIVCLRKSYLLN